MRNLSELAKYVGIKQAAEILGTDVKTIVHTAAHGRLQLCVNIYGRSDMVRMRRQKESDFDSEIVGEIHYVPTCDEVRDAEYWESRISALMPAGIYELDPEDVRFFEIDNAIEIHEARKTDELGVFDVKFDPPVPAEISDLVILMHEIKRLQQTSAAPQQLPQQAAAAPQVEADKLHPKRETTYLNIIAALVELIQSPMPGRDSDAAVIRELVDNYGDRPGISKRNLEDVFPVAKKRLQSD